MRRVSVALIVAMVCLSAGFVNSATAQVGSVGPTGGLSMTQVPTEPTTSLLGSTTEDVFSLSLFFRSFRGWGTSVNARPAYRTPALVLRERVGMNKPR
jgi:hypothetical protein